MLTPLQRQALMDAIALVIDDDIKPLVSGPYKATLLLRSESKADGDVLVTDDNIPDAIKAMRRLEEYEQV